MFDGIACKYLLIIVVTPLALNTKQKMQSHPVKNPEITEDYLLGGRILVRQPAHGYRVAIDPIFLAASVDVQENESVLDVGAGVGAASLCLAYRVPTCKIVGLEIQRSNVRLAMENIALNNMRGRVEILVGDLLQPPPRLAGGTFAHVMANPPYLEDHRASVSATDHKQTSHTEGHVSLMQWAKFALLMARPKGTITFIHRADRLHEILSYFHGKLGDITIFPLWPGPGKPAKRVLVRGRKSTQGPTVLSQGLTLHHPDGRYTEAADNILRNGASLIL
jgi:tRNA1(Val) A37 N6-methylase TrmN6